MFALVLTPLGWLIVIVLLLSLLGLFAPWPSGIGARPGYYYPAGIVWVVLLIILLLWLLGAL